MRGNFSKGYQGTRCGCPDCQGKAVPGNRGAWKASFKRGGKTAKNTRK